MMKKNILILVVLLASVVMFSSCEKEGVYKPKEKISRIFTQYGSNAKKLSQTWTWDGNLLSRITYSGGAYRDFQYDGSRLVSVRYISGSYTYKTDFIYDGNKLSKIQEYSSDGLLDYEYTITHDGKKISQINVTEYYYYDDEYKSTRKSSALDILFPNSVINKDFNKIASKRSENKVASKSAVETYTWSYKFEWDKDNLSKMIYEETYDGEFWSETNEYTYDDKLNPYYGSMYEIWNPEVLTSKNNVVKEVSTDSDGDYDESEYSYQYAGKFPTERRHIIGSSVYTTFYEYE